MGATAVLENPTLFDLLGDLQVLDVPSVIRLPQPTAPGGGGAPGDAPDEEWARRSWPGGEPTLDDLIVDAWEGLTAHAAVACPVCGGSMEPEPRDRNPGGSDPYEPASPASHAPAPAPIAAAGRCGDCGTSLS